jgi:hypothetical protein
MRRDEAVAILSRHEVAALAPEERRNVLLDWWRIDGEDPDYDGLPAEVRTALEILDEPPDDVTAPTYDRLLELAIGRSFVGVLNAYLERRLAEVGRTEPVDGEIEPLFACRCCGYRTLGERGCYSICRVCFWEDDLIEDPDAISGPNHMSLREARRNFEAIGAMSEAMRVHVLPDGTERYAFEPRALI